MKEEYRSAAEKRHANDSDYGNKKIHPQELARQAHVEGIFAEKQRNEFFDKAFGEIMVDYFDEWLRTASHETKRREFLYECAMALGDVKQRLIAKEMYGKNVPHIDIGDKE